MQENMERRDTIIKRKENNFLIHLLEEQNKFRDRGNSMMNRENYFKINVNNRVTH